MPVACFPAVGESPAPKGRLGRSSLIGVAGTRRGRSDRREDNKVSGGLQMVLFHDIITKTPTPTG